MQTCISSFRKSFVYFLMLSAFAFQSKAQTSVQFSLDKKYTTSAGAYKPDGTLVRTLWRGETYEAGTHTATWDGRDDAGNQVPAGQYQVKLLYHNIKYVWDGAIGNTSEKQSGPSVYQGFQSIYGMAIDGREAYYVAGYNESQYIAHKFNITNPRAKTPIIEADNFIGLELVAADSSKVYMANTQGGFEGAYTTFVYAIKRSDNSEATFTNGQRVVIGSRGESVHNSVIDFDQVNSQISLGHTGSENRATGLAVQRNGNILAVAHRQANEVRLFDKNSGALLRTISISRPGGLGMASNGDLWVCSGTTVVRYTNLNTNPVASATIIGLEEALAVAVDPTNSNCVLIGDGGSSQQVKAFDQNGNSLWTYGQLGGYAANGSLVTSDKFWFEINGRKTTFISIAPDHSFWVGDGGNGRCLHFSANRAYIDQIMYQTHTYVAAVDANNPNRVFNAWLEFAVDYTRPIGESWTLVRNWKVGMGSAYTDLYYQGIRQVTTLSNGRTYGFVRVRVNSSEIEEIVELTGNALRRTGIYPVYPNMDTQTPTLMADGTLHITPKNTNPGATATWYKRDLTGFDSSGNPQWAATVPMASVTAAAQDPMPRDGSNGGDIKGLVTSSGVLVSFDQGKGSGWHLGGLRLGSTEWLWKASPAGDLDGKGKYEIGNGLQYGGNTTLVSDRHIIYGYHGEFFRGGPGQAGQFMHFYDDGLFVGQFGETSIDHNAKSGAIAGFAGNAMCPVITKVGKEIYIWVNDESSHGPQRWHLVGANTVQEAENSGSLGSTIVLNTPTNQQFPVRVTATPGNARIQLTWSSVRGALGYSVKYALHPGGPYNSIAVDSITLVHTLQNLANDTDYYVTVSALLSGGTGPDSEEVLARPADPAVTVQIAGRWSSVYTEFDVKASAMAQSKPTLEIHPVLRYNQHNLLHDEVGSKGYSIYNWGGTGTDNTNLSGAFAINKDNGWGTFGFAGFRFNVNNQSGTDITLQSNPANNINIVVADTAWHTLTVFSPAIFDAPRDFSIHLRPQGQMMPDASYSVSELGGKNHIFQFRFKGNVTLTVDNRSGGNGTLQAVFLDNEIVARPLPVELLGFTAERKGASALLRWATASEQNSSHFEVQVSTDGRTFRPVGQVQAKGTTQQRSTYQFTDPKLSTYPTRQVYYRLRQVDYDGTATYSPVRVVAVLRNAGLTAQAFPNPFHADLSLLVQTDEAGPATLTLINPIGTVVAQREMVLDKGNTPVAVPEAARLTPGIYIAQVQQGARQYSVKIVRE